MQEVVTAKPDSVSPEHFSEWNEEMIKRCDPDRFYDHPRSVARWLERRRVRAVLSHLDLRPEHRVLDLGCGGGHVLRLLGPCQRHGVDLSGLMVRRAQERLADGATIIQADAEQLPYAAESFDRVIASSLLSHVLHPEAVLAELRRVTRPGGLIVLSISDEAQIEKGIRWMRRLGLERPLLGQQGSPALYNVEYHLHRFSLPRLRELAEPHLRETHLHAIPCKLFPVHWVVVYKL